MTTVGEHVITVGSNADVRNQIQLLIEKGVLPSDEQSPEVRLIIDFVAVFSEQPLTIEQYDELWFDHVCEPPVPLDSVTRAQLSELFTRVSEVVLNEMDYEALLQYEYELNAEHAIS